jgi:predicted nuclease of restriction endonuclease-like (RecB) superfamily
MAKKVEIKKPDLNYNEILQSAIVYINTARSLIAKQVNNSTNSVYWNLGKLLFEKKIEEGHGSGVVKQLSFDLKNNFPDMGVSPRNLWDMKRFYVRYYLSDSKLRQAVAVLPWGHNILLMNKIDSDAAISFYANEIVTKGWSRDLLLNAIKLQIHEKFLDQSKAHNFDSTLPSEHAEYANEVFKSSYNLGFLGITNPVHEVDLENRLISKIKASKNHEQ